MAAAAVSGVVLVAGAAANAGAGEPSAALHPPSAGAGVDTSAVGSAAVDPAGTGPAGSVEEQFSRAFTEGAAWDPPVVMSIKPPSA
ncbi:hypothetical protein [Micromonospora sp. CPCC 205561]|uniref:hypothetical protein n=1 Tax=Micromonospora sp. CPCC 205561 TaxID=3122407 RepID=UPI002FEF4FAA